MDLEHATLVNEVRYAERLCLRTARLYRRVQTVGTFLTILGGSAVMTAISGKVPAEVAVAGAVLFAIFGSALLAIRPADKVAANEADAKRYAKLRSEARALSVEQLRIAIDKARESDTAEVESLRLVAYNDVMAEIGQSSAIVRLSRTQQLLGSLA